MFHGLCNSATYLHSVISLKLFHVNIGKESCTTGKQCSTQDTGWKALDSEHHLSRCTCLLKIALVPRQALCAIGIRQGLRAYFRTVERRNLMRQHHCGHSEAWNHIKTCNIPLFRGDKCIHKEIIPSLLLSA